MAVLDVVGASVAVAAGRMKTRVVDDVLGDEAVKALHCRVEWLLAASMFAGDRNGACCNTGVLPCTAQCCGDWQGIEQRWRTTRERGYVYGGPNTISCAVQSTPPTSLSTAQSTPHADAAPHIPNPPIAAAMPTRPVGRGHARHPCSNVV